MFNNLKKLISLVFATVLLTSISSTSFAIDKLHFIIGGGGGGGYFGGGAGRSDSNSNPGSYGGAGGSGYIHPELVTNGTFEGENAGAGTAILSKVS